jgi:hypothetical protein
MPELIWNISHKIYQTETSRDKKGSRYGKQVGKRMDTKVHKHLRLYGFR